MQHYPLPSNYLGVEYVAILGHLVSSTALKIPNLSADPELLDVVLEPDNLHHGWRIRCDYGYLGWLDREESALYPLMERLRNARMVASTWATVAIVENNLEVAVFLGLAPWQIPVNNAPQGSLLFNSGHPVILHPALSLDALDAMGCSQFICQLKAVGTSFHAVVESTTLGIFYPPQHVADSLTHAASKHLTISARGYSAGGLLALDLPADPQQLFISIPPPLEHARPVIPAMAAPASWEALVSMPTLVEKILLPPPTGERALPAAPSMPTGG